MPPDSRYEGLSQTVRDFYIQRQAVPGRGNGLVATQDLAAGAQVLFVQRPLMLALETSRLQDTCYYCFHSGGSSSNDATTQPDVKDDINLKACTGCHTVKFCGKGCQTQAWLQYHKHECKLFSKLHPRILPSAVRAVIRLLKQRKAGLLPSGEWEQLQDLESHQDDLRIADGERWQNLFLMIKAVNTYSATEESMDVVLRICCILLVNSFTLTTPTFDPLGLIFHPLPALINHSCTPNAFVRFDVPSTSSSDLSSTAPRYSTLTIQLLSPVSKDTELTISYVDPTYPFGLRQSELKERYFFICSCQLCMQRKDAIIDRFLPSPDKITTSSTTLERLESQATQTLQSSQSRSSTDAQHIPALLTALSQLAQPGVWPLHRYPSPQVRQQLILGLLAQNKFSAALRQALVLSRADTVLYDGCDTGDVPADQRVRAWHPTAMVHRFRLFRLARYCAATVISGGSTATTQDADLNPHMLSLLSCVTIDDLSTSISYPKSTENAFAFTDGVFEAIIHAAHAEMQQDADAGVGRSYWDEYTRDKAAVRQSVRSWVNMVIGRVMENERMGT